MELFVELFRPEMVAHSYFQREEGEWELPLTCLTEYSTALIFSMNNLSHPPSFCPGTICTFSRGDARVN